MTTTDSPRCEACGVVMGHLFAGSGDIRVKNLTARCRACGHVNELGEWPRDDTRS